MPARLRRPVEIAAEKLTVREGRDFTPAHRRLWAEFMNRAFLPPNVRGLFARTGAVLDTPGLRLLDAVDAEGNLAASLLLDDAPRRFCSYLIGAHSRTHYTPHAADLLFAHMSPAREADKEYVHLGLGVNDGIRRFKTKWGGRPALPYVMASWRETPRETGSETISSLVRILLESPSDLSKRQIFDSLPQQRPFAMLWELTKNGRTSWIGGTAHFFCYSFEAAFRNLFERVDTVLFEGPLDADSLDEVARIGKTPDGRHPPLIDLLEEPEIRLLERVVQGPTGKLARFFNAANPNPPTCGGCSQPPGTGMHSSRCGRHISNGRAGTSPDLCAWHTALEMGKSVIGMESLEEQVASLESVPLGRVTAFFRGCRSWKGYARRNIHSYLDGDLEGMLGTSTEFPSRTEQIIDGRNQRFRERMRPFLEEGRAAVFVGSAHMLQLRDMLAEDGFTVRQAYPTWRHRLRAAIRGRMAVSREIGVRPRAKAIPPDPLEMETPFSAIW
ncbi:MAG: TraB/GumN family protein [Bilophila wadsworthia]